MPCLFCYTCIVSANLSRITSGTGWFVHFLHLVSVYVQGEVLVFFNSALQLEIIMHVMVCSRKIDRALQWHIYWVILLKKLVPLCMKVHALYENMLMYQADRSSSYVV